jgi:type IV secretory pathway VirB10-like protein
MSFCGYIGSVLADAGDIFEIVIIGIFILFSAVANLIHAAAAKKKEQALEEQKSTAGIKERPAPQKAETPQQKRLPYAKMAAKSPWASRQGTASASTPKISPFKPSKVLYPVAQLAGQRKDAVSRPVITQPKPVQPRTAPREVQKQSVKTAARIDQEASKRMNVVYLRKMLKNPNQIRYLVAASEILDKPLSLR